MKTRSYDEYQGRRSLSSQKISEVFSKNQTNGWKGTTIYFLKFESRNLWCPN